MCVAQGYEIFDMSYLLVVGYQSYTALVPRRSGQQQYHRANCNGRV